MINSHEFQQAAKRFRSGRISLKEFTDLVYGDVSMRNPNEEPSIRKDQPGLEVQLPRVAEMRPIQLTQRSLDSHKGDYGRIAAIGGSIGMSGAIGLTGLAALRTGSGLVKVVVPKSIQSEVALLCPCLMTVGCLPDDGCFHASARDLIQTESNWADVIALGPGLGRSESLQAIVMRLYGACAQPIVVDADGLNVLVDAKYDLSNHDGQRILTPHPGEFQRLAGTQITNRAKLEQAAFQLAQESNVVIALKGKGTYVTDGTREYRNETGNPGMATAGSGDVLTGVITSLVGQGISTFDAACLGVHVHGMAGDFAAASVGETSLIATDIVEHLPVALKKHAASCGVTIGFQSN